MLRPTGWLGRGWRVLLAGLCLAAGCGQSPEEPGVGAEPAPAKKTVAESAPDASPTVATPPPDAPPVDLAVLKPWTGDFDGMVERRVIRVLVVPSKTYYFVEAGQPRGTAYEALKAFEEDVNRELGKKLVKIHAVFLPVSRGEVIPALLEGRGDVAAAGLAVTEERRKKVDFSAPLWDDVSEIVVTGPRSPALATVDDLAGQEVFTRRSSSYWEHLEELNRRLKSAGKAEVKLKEAPEELEDEDLLEMLNAGLFGIAVVHEPIANLWAKVLPSIKPRPEIAVHTGGEIAWMIRKDSPKLKAELDGFVESHGKGTAFGNTVVKRYVGSTQFVKSSTSAEEIQKFRQLTDLFRKYARQYDADYLLMMAQGYQESRLDQGVRSPVGAVGVMQIMPATGTDLKVGDIHQLEANVHGGVKYMRFMIDRYFKDEPMTPLDKALFTFASYNAGPARVRGLRQEAAARGLDPNRWFNNVELVAADKIGAETVTYVSNIYKYYIAYKLVLEESQKREAVKAKLEGN